MAERKRAESETAGGFTAEEQGVIEESAPELRRSRRSGGRDDAPKAEREVLAKIAEMQEPDRVMAERLHAVIRTHAPSLVPRTWYGMPAYARGGKVVCFFQGAHKFKTRYATLGFTDQANLDDGAMWPTAFALEEFTAAEEARVVAILSRAVS